MFPPEALGAVPTRVDTPQLQFRRSTTILEAGGFA
jgi:hypothetical protein